jgi:hypothetical protein
VPGNVDALFQIPVELLAPGEHVVALRMSSLHTGFSAPTYSLNFAWGNFRAMLVNGSRTAILSVMAVGASLVGAVVFGLMWLLAGGRRSVLWFSLLFLCVALMQGLQAWRWLYEYPYHWHYPRLLAITALTTAMAVLLPAFVIAHFNVGRVRSFFFVHAVFLAIAWAITPIYNLISALVCGIGFCSALGVSIRAVWLRRRGAMVAGAGLLVSVVALIAAPRDFLENAFFLSGGPAVVGLLAALVLQLRDERRDAQRAVLSAARLELELLKKNIQPHFLLNTLATIMEVIEREPKTAVTMIEALADEFRLLAGVSGEKLIPLAREVELCRAHLAVMSLRKGVQGTLDVRGAEGGESVPPALFHTLIENGLTHLLPSRGRIDFALDVSHFPPLTRYVLLARGEKQTANGEAHDGTGLRYVKARLEESFTGRWTVAARAVPEGWETMIEIASEAAARSADASVRPGAARVPRLEHLA